MRYDAIVIGSGVGGSVAAAVMAANGQRVCLLEKNNRTGGVCASFEREGFSVDIGTHMFSRGRKGPLGRLTRRLGIAPIPFVQTEDLAHVSGFGQMLRIPRDVHRYPTFLAQAAWQLRLRPRDMWEATRFFGDILRFDEARLPEYDRMSMWDFVTGYTRNPRLVGLFGLLLGLYFILPLRDASAGEGIWCFKRMVFDRGLSYPRGGAAVVPNTFVDAARSRGADVLLNHKVSSVEVHGGAVRAVTCSDGQVLEAPVVIATTSLKDLIGLVGEAQFPSTYVDRVRALKSSMIAVQAKVALKRPLVEAGALVGVTGEGLDPTSLELGDLDRLYGDILEGRLPPLTPIYAPVPSNFDHSLAPPGMQLITACAAAPTSDIPLVQEGAVWEQNLMRSLSAMIPGIDGEILWSSTMSVQAIGRWMGKLYAPAVSTGQTPSQVGNRRPPVRTPVRGLYAAGCNAGGRGVGTELAAVSGEEAADAAICDLFNGLVY